VAAGFGLAGAAFVAFYFDVPRGFIVFPFMIWAALRFWQPGAVAAGLLVAAFAIPFTAHDHGSFAGLNLDDRLQLAQTFVGVAAMSALILAAVMTERQRIEDTARYISETLQRGLLPANLPEIPGIETAVESQPAGEGDIVSGDFYDWFETTRAPSRRTPGLVSSRTRPPGSFVSGARSWDVMLGDIGGKGAAAARTTALARYTLRADAVHEDRPSRILALLNGALRRQAPGETCTVAYGRLILRRDDRAELMLSLAGHPLPLVVRKDGAVEQLGAAGNLLGAISDPLLADHHALLAPGDAVLLYTDGLTDAYAPQRVVSIDELIEALTSCAGCGAADIAMGVQRVVLGGDGGGSRDDITVLVLRVAGPR
jgi:serine phosphatase RsbU (regulator of sigma subunit)